VFMSVIDEILRANERFVRGFKAPDLPIPPARGLAVLICMDARIDVFAVLGLRLGDAHVIRNAGGLATEDTVRSLILSHHLLGTREIMVVNHTDCGMLTFKDEELRSRLRQKTGKDADEPRAFHAFSSLEENLREQIRKIREHPWLPDELVVRGFIYEMRTGALSEVV
jgi:carbonic anhydrase